MKKIILTLTIALASAYGYSQQTDSRLLAVYSESELKQIKETDQEHYKVLVYGLENAVYTSPFPKDKGMDNIPTIKLPKGDYTFASLGLRLEDETQYFKIEGSNLMLIVKAKQILKYELQQNLK